MKPEFKYFAPFGKQVIRRQRVVFQCITEEASYELAVALDAAVKQVAEKFPEQFKSNENGYY